MNLSKIWSHSHQPVKYICTILLIMGCSLHSVAQNPYDPEKVPKKAQELYQKAYEALKEKGFEAAIKILQEAVKAEPKFLDAWATIGGLFQEKKNYQLAIENYEKSIEINPQNQNGKEMIKKLKNE